MKLKRRIALHGEWMDELDERIVVSSIEPGDGKETISATETAAGFGQRITRKTRSTVDVVVKFRIFEHGKSVAGMQERSELLEKVIAWAAPGGVLLLNYRPNRRLNVVLAQAPGEGSLWDYTREFQLTFRAYTIPYWEDREANKETFGGSDAQKAKNVNLEGSAKTQFHVYLKNTSGQKINNVSMLKIGDNTMSFTQLGLMGNETLVVDHSNGLVRIRIQDTGGNYRSAMKYRTGANDFTAEPGTVYCGYKAERACEMTVTWRARYL